MLYLLLNKTALCPSQNDSVVVSYVFPEYFTVTDLSYSMEEPGCLKETHLSSTNGLKLIVI